MRNAKSQRGKIMIRLRSLRQASGSHVSHAEIGDCSVSGPSCPGPWLGSSSVGAPYAYICELDSGSRPRVRKTRQNKSVECDGWCG